MRLSEDHVWMEVAVLVAFRSKCVRSAVGCVLTDDTGRVVATGYNGPPATFERAKGRESCDAFCGRATAEERCEGFSDCVSVHAELNALLYATRPPRGGTAYVTKRPCRGCAVALAQAGLRSIVWRGDSTEDFALRQFLRLNGVHGREPHLSHG